MSPRGEDRKAAILDAAVARIVAHGIEGLRVRDVAQDVGINNATLHHHFATKTALLAALVQRFVAGFQIAGGTLEVGTLEERLAAYVAARRAQMLETPEPFIVMSELILLARRDDDVRRLLAPLQDRWHDKLVAICRAAGADPATAAAHAERCRREVLGMILDLGLGRLG